LAGKVDVLHKSNFYLFVALKYFIKFMWPRIKEIGFISYLMYLYGLYTSREILCGSWFCWLPNLTFPSPA